MMKIFISIASYQDPMLTSTILSAYENADLPQNLIFGICDQSSESIDLDNFSFKDQIKYDLVDPVISEGPCWARTRVQRMFENEDYYLQIDSHMQFKEGWDSYLIKNLNLLQSINTNMHQFPIITCYPRSFKIIDFDCENRCRYSGEILIRSCSSFGRPGNSRNSPATKIKNAFDRISLRL